MYHFTRWNMSILIHYYYEFSTLGVHNSGSSYYGNVINLVVINSLDIHQMGGMLVEHTNIAASKSTIGSVIK